MSLNVLKGKNVQSTKIPLSPLSPQEFRNIWDIQKQYNFKEWVMATDKSNCTEVQAGSLFTLEKNDDTCFSRAE